MVSNQPMWLLLGFVLSAFPRAEGQICPEGWTSHGESCYHFLKETYNWFDAQSVCTNLDAYLAEDTSAETHNFLLNLSRVKDTHVWLGLQDFFEEGVFVWSQSKQRANPTFWSPGEPQDANGEEDCVGMDQEHSGWFDANCEDGRYASVCEMPAEGEPVVG